MLLPKEMRCCVLCNHHYNNPFRPHPICLFHDEQVIDHYCCDDYETHRKIKPRDIEMAKNIVKTYVFLRRNNHTIPDDVLEFMKVSSLETLRDIINDQR